MLGPAIGGGGFPPDGRRLGPASQPSAGAFARIELLAILLALTLVALVCLPALARSREPAHRVVCANNLRQVTQALLMFSAEHEQHFPPRNLPGAWPDTLYPYYRSLALLRCPSDPSPSTSFSGDTNRYPADSAPRSYLFNGWNDYWVEHLTNATPGNLGNLRGQSFPETALKVPSGTIVFGEKESGSAHYYFDCLAQPAGNDVDQLEQARHSGAALSPDSGGSNFAFADGTVRCLRYGQSLQPTNLWAVIDAWRVTAPSP
jgi:prepilin-type processing-associated H-X9-DG protein